MVCLKGKETIPNNCENLDQIVVTEPKITEAAQLIKNIYMLRSLTLLTLVAVAASRTCSNGEYCCPDASERR